MWLIECRSGTWVSLSWAKDEAIVFTLQFPFNQANITFTLPNEKFPQHRITFNAFRYRTEYFLNNLSRYVTNNLNELYPNIRQSCGSYDVFWDAFLKFIRHLEKYIFNLNNPFAMKILPLFFSDLQKHKFRPSFIDTLNLLCSFPVLYLLKGKRSHPCE